LAGDTLAVTLTAYIAAISGKNSIQTGIPFLGINTRYGFNAHFQVAPDLIVHPG